MEQKKSDFDIAPSRKVSWCPICSSVEIRTLLKTRAAKNGISFFLLCKHLGIRYTIFKKYWLTAISPGAVKDCRAKEIVAIAEVLGVKVKVIVAVGNIDTEKVKGFVKVSKLKIKYVTVDQR